VNNNDQLTKVFKDHQIEKLVRICTALVRRCNGEVTLSKQELETPGKLMRRVEIDERLGTNDVFLKVEE
jgi:hypothetical protein